mmetsp:Transcript_66841/g.186614  ORF Transcript_66841/g.186614 Transcript_66841/m.186614 type:complete len:446 (+) Transcript_66841:472-1809(+)
MDQDLLLLRLEAARSQALLHVSEHHRPKAHAQRAHGASAVALHELLGERDDRLPRLPHQLHVSRDARVKVHVNRHFFLRRRAEHCGGGLRECQLHDAVRPRLRRRPPGLQRPGGGGGPGLRGDFHFEVVTKEAVDEASGGLFDCVRTHLLHDLRRLDHLEHVLHVHCQAGGARPLFEQDLAPRGADLRTERAVLVLVERSEGPGQVGDDVDAIGHEVAANEAHVAEVRLGLVEGILRIAGHAALDELVLETEHAGQSRRELYRGNARELHCRDSSLGALEERRRLREHTRGGRGRVGSSPRWRRRDARSHRHPEVVRDRSGLPEEVAERGHRLKGGVHDTARKFTSAPCQAIPLLRRDFFGQERLRHAAHDLGRLPGEILVSVHGQKASSAGGETREVPEEQQPHHALERGRHEACGRVCEGAHSVARAGARGLRSDPSNSTQTI